MRKLTVHSTPRETGGSRVLYRHPDDYTFYGDVLKLQYFGMFKVQVHKDNGEVLDLLESGFLRCDGYGRWGGASFLNCSGMYKLFSIAFSVSATFAVNKIICFHTVNYGVYW